MNNGIKSALSCLKPAFFLVTAALSVGTSAFGQEARNKIDSPERKEIALIQSILAERKFDFHAARSVCGEDEGVRFFAEYQRCETVVDSLKRGAFRIIPPLEAGAKLTDLRTYNKIFRQCGNILPPKLNSTTPAVEYRQALQEALDPSSAQYVALYKIFYDATQHASLFVLRQEDFVSKGGNLRSFGGLLSFAVPGCKGLISQPIQKPPKVRENQSSPQRWFSGPIIIDDKRYLINVWADTEYIPGDSVVIEARSIGIAPADNRFQMYATDAR